MSKTARPSQAKAKSQEFILGLPFGKQGPNYLKSITTSKSVPQGEQEPETELGSNAGILVWDVHILLV